MDNLGKNCQEIIWLKIRYSILWLSIGEKCEPKPILARAQVPQRVIKKEVAFVINLLRKRSLLPQRGRLKGPSKAADLYFEIVVEI
jgi:hypothetical protein